MEKIVSTQVPPEALRLFPERKNTLGLDSALMHRPKTRNPTIWVNNVLEKLSSIELPSYRIRVIGNNILLETDTFDIRFGVASGNKYDAYYFELEGDDYEEIKSYYNEIIGLKEEGGAEPTVQAQILWGGLDGRMTNYEIISGLRYSLKDVAPFYPYLNMEELAHYVYSPSSILIFQGPPGTGKTRLIEAILYEFWKGSKQSVNVLYTANTAAHKNPDAWKIAMYKDLFILDDADDLLHGREADTRGSINVLDILRLSDSLFELPLKLIFTTNSPDVKIDDAFLRPGRTYGVYKFRDLKKDEIPAAIEGVERLYPELKRIKSDDCIKDEMSLAEVFGLFDYSQLQIRRAIGFSPINNPKNNRAW